MLSLLLAVSLAADPSPPTFKLDELLHRVGAWEDGPYAAVLARGSWTEDFVVEALDGDGKVTSTARGTAHVTVASDQRTRVIVRCEVDGKVKPNPEKLTDCQPDAKFSVSGDPFTVSEPFDSDSQKHFAFSAIGTPANGKVRIHFQPKQGDGDSGDGDVDIARGVLFHVEVLGAPQSHIDHATHKVDYADFGALGTLPSRMEFSGSGSFLWIHAGMRGHATLSGYQLAR